MPIKVEAPDGSVVEFPDGMSNDHIAGVMRQQFGKPSAAQASPGAASSGVMQAVRGVGETAHDFADQFRSQGMLMGFGDEAFGALNTPIEMGIRAFTGEDAGKGIGERISGAYTEGRDAGRARDRAAQERSPVASGLGELAGALATGGTAMRAGASLIPHVAGKGLTARGVAGAGEGYGYGYTHGFGTGEGLGDSHKSGVRSGTTGLMFGAAAPVVASGAGSAAKWGMKGWQMLTKKVGLGKMPPEKRKAATRILMDLEESGMSVDDAARRLDELGPEGMIADVSPTMQQRTGQLAAADPPTSRGVTGRLKARREAGGQRVGQALDDAFGPAKDPYAVTASRKAVSNQVGPEYRAAYAEPFDPTSVIKQIDDAVREARGPIRGKLMEARKLLIDYPGGKPQPITKGGQAHQARIALDDMLDGIKMDSSVGKHTAGALRDIRKALDAEMKGQIGQFKSADARYATAARQQDAFEYGRGELLRGGPSTQSPGQAAARLRSMSGPERQGVRQGARFELDRQLSNQRRNPALTAESALSKDFNDQKARLLVGRQPAARLGQNLDREKTFIETSNLAEAGRGSRTGMIQPQQGAAGETVDVAGPAIVGAITGNPIAAIGTFGAQMSGRLARNGLAGLAKRAEAAIGRTQAAMMTASGPKRQAVVSELRDLARQIERAGDAEAAAELMTLVGVVQQGHRAEPFMPDAILPAR